MTDVEPDRFILAIAYQSGRNPLIKRGADGHRDYFTERDVELASRTFMRQGNMQMGIMHADGTLGHAEVVESYIWRGEPKDFTGTLVKSGDWIIGAILDESAWAAVKDGRLTGLSPQGGGRRVRPA